MARIGFVADVHIANWRRFGGPVENGLNRRARETIQTLVEAGKICRKQRVDALVILGDLFDHPHPSPALVRATAEALLTCADRIIVLLGNHDMQSDGEWDHACSSMGLHERIQVVHEPTVARVGVEPGAELLLCPYRPGAASEWLPSSLAGLGLASRHQGGRVLCTHLGIWDDFTPPYLKAAKDAVGIGQVRWLCDAHAIDCVLAGNWHAFNSWGLSGNREGPAVVIPGTLCPQGWQEPDQSKVGSLIVVDTTAGSRCPSLDRHSVAGPRWGTITEFHSELRATAPDFGPTSPGWPLARHLYWRLRARRDNLEAALALKAELEEVDAYTVFVEVAEGDDEHLARDAAAQARAAASPESAIELFAQMKAKVDEPGTLEGVMRRLDAYRKAAAE